ncbi:MAG: hypothetical protein GWP09_02870 [Nitrospiraceae bacterium]|nr:hypothetical protein [Nitrospiraceae bacterium]
MESIEVWLWVFVGLLVVAVMLPIFFHLVNISIHHQEVNQVIENLNQLTSQVSSACKSGFFYRVDKTLTFPSSLNTVFVVRETNASEICVTLVGDNKIYCNRVNQCYVSNLNISSRSDLRVFYIYSRMFKEDFPYSIKFTINKHDVILNNQLSPGAQVNWTPTLAPELP